MNDPKYRENAKLIKKKLALSPFKPAEKLIRWVEFAAEFPDLNELNMPSDEEMGWFKYYSMDAITFTFAIFGVIIWIGWKLLRIGMEMVAQQRHKLKEQ